MPDSYSSAPLDADFRISPIPGWFLPAVAIPESRQSSTPLYLVQPNNVAIVGPANINNCEQVTFTLVIINDAFTSTNVMVTRTVPSGSFSPTEYFRNVGELGPGQTTIFTDTFGARCSAVSGQYVATLSQDGRDTFQVFQDYEIVPGAITLRKEPNVIEAGIGEAVTWTVIVENTGYGTVSNVVVTDTLGAGLAYLSGFTAATFPLIAVGATESFTVAAEVISCSELENDVTASWGCGGENCQDQTASAHVDLKIDQPILYYNPPDLTIDYCTNSSSFTMPIENIGDGQARRIFIGVDLSDFTLSNISAGAVYTTNYFATSSPGFVLSDPLPAGDVYTLSFDAGLAQGCGAANEGKLLFRPDYLDSCDNLYKLPIRIGKWTRTGSYPTLNVEKSMPREIELGDTIDAVVSVTANNIQGSVTVTDTIPPGWTVTDPAGGNVVTVGTTVYIVWAGVDTGTTVFTPVLQSPVLTDSSCAYCGTRAQNRVEATATDCLDCALNATQTVNTYIQCGGGLEVSKSVLPLTDQNCSSYWYTNTVTFGNSFSSTAGWAGMVLTESMNNSQQFQPGTLQATVISGSSTFLLSAFPNTSSGQLVITFTGLSTVPMAGSTLNVSYELQTTDSSQSSCSNAEWYDWSEFDAGASAPGVCGGDGTVQEGVYVGSQAPSMQLQTTGLPPVAASCAIYTTSLTATRTSLVPAFDVDLNIVTSTYAILEVMGYGGLTPVATTTDASGYHFLYGDQFINALTATVDLKIQLRCTERSAPLVANLYYDNHCADDDQYEHGCSTGGQLSTPDVFGPRPILYKFPETIYAEGDVVTWTLTAINSGAGDAHSVTLTDTLGSDLRYLGSTITSTYGSAAGASPITSSNLVTWTDLLLLSGELYTIKYAAEIIGCDDLTNDFFGSQGCLDQTCLAGSPEHSQVVLPPTELINTNIAHTPLGNCLTSTITATVRNVGLLSVFNAIITETLPTGMYYISNTAEYAIGTGTTPPTGPWLAAEPTSPGTGLLQWTENEIGQLNRLYPAQTVWVRFDVRGSCNFEGGNVTVVASYQDTCGNPQRTTTSSYAVPSRPAQVSATKLGRNLSTGSSWGELTYATPGDSLEWALTVTNQSETPALFTIVTDTIPSNLSVTGISPVPSYSAGNVISWNVGTISTSWSARISTTVKDNGCTETDVNNVFTASWGCEDGCRWNTTDQAALRTRPVFGSPNLGTLLPNHTLHQCGGAMTITLRNQGPPAYNTYLTDTLPSGFVYSDTVFVSTIPSVTPPAGVSQPVWAWTGSDLLPTGLTTVSFRIRNEETSGICNPIPGRTNTITLSYDDHDSCTSVGPYQAMTSTETSLASPSLFVLKTPVKQVTAVGQRITWTLYVTNQGPGSAYNVIITDQLGSTFTDPVASLGSDGSTPVRNGQVITWALSTPMAAAGSSWMATLSAVVSDTGSNLNVITAATRCDSGCSSTPVATQAHTTLVGDFGKTPAYQTGTIGSLLVFTITGTATDRDTVYQDIRITDELPTGLGYVSSTLTFVYDDGAHRVVSHTPSISPGWLASGSVAWYLGDLAGSVDMRAVITAVVQDIPDNQAGVRRTNIVTASWVDTGVSYAATDTTEADIVEPSLLISKGADSSTGSLVNLNGNDWLTYTIRLTNSGTSPAFDVSIIDTLPRGISLTNIYGGDSRSSAIQGPGVLTWTVSVISHAPGGTNNPLVLSYTARLSGAAASGSPFIALTNNVTASYSSLAGDPPPEQERDYGPITATEVVSPASANTTKAVAPPSSRTNNLKIGDVVTYTIVNLVPPGLVAWWPYQYDNLRIGMRYITGTFTVTSTMPFSGATPLATSTVFASATGVGDTGVSGMTATDNPNVGPTAGSAARQSIEWWLQPLNNAPSTVAGLVTLTFQAQVVGTRLNNGNELWTDDQTNSRRLRNNQVLNWNPVNSGTYTTTQPIVNDNARVDSRVGQPALDIVKSAEPPSGSYVAAGQAISYFLVISNAGRSPAFDIVVSDTLPGGIAFQGVSLISTSPATASIVAQPSVGATGAITFGVDQLNGLDATVLGDNKYLTLTVLARVTDTAGANLVLTNTAQVPYYDSQPGPGPSTGLTPTQRPYSDGSSQVQHRTINSGIAKRVVFSPPPTATLGTLVTYTLLVPAQPITATLYDVVVTDSVDSRLVVVDAIVTGGFGSALIRSRQLVTATFASITQGTQALITITTRISAGLGAQDGDLIPDISYLIHRDGPLTNSNQVQTAIGEPNIIVDKAVDATELDNLERGATLTYTIHLTNAGTSPAYSIYVADAVPAGISVTNQLGGDSRSGPVVGSGTMTWYVGYLSSTIGANVSVLTYTARLTEAVSGQMITNRVDILYHSLTGTVPGVRPYTNTDVAEIQPGLPNLSKITQPRLLRVGDVVTYTLTFTIPPGVVGMGDDSFLVDTLPPGVHYITDSEHLSWIPNQVPAFTTARGIGNVGINDVISWAFGSPITSLLDTPTVIALSFQAQATGQPADQWPDNGIMYDVTDTAQLVQRGILVDQDTADNQVIQPDLAINKTSTPPSGSTVTAGDLISYTLVVVNDGHGPAYDILVTDTLPAGIDYVRTISAPNPGSATITPSVTGHHIRYTVSQLTAGPAATMFITVLGQVADTVAANEILTNTARVPYYDSQPGGGPSTGLTPTQRPYSDGESSVDHVTVIEAAIVKTLLPPTATLGSVITYVLFVPSPGVGAALSDVTVRDQIDSRLQLHTVVTGPPGIDGTLDITEHRITATFPNIPAWQQRLITITAVLSDPLGATTSQVITNTATMQHQTGGPTLSNQTAFTVFEPLLGIDKVSYPASGSAVQAGQAVTYGVWLTNASGLNASTAYDVVMTDTLPNGMRDTSPSLLSVLLNGSPVDSSQFTTSYTPASGLFVVRFVSTFGIPRNGTLWIQYLSGVDTDVEAGSGLTNRAVSTWSSLPGKTPGNRDYGPIQDTTTLTTPLATGLVKSVDPDISTIGSQVVFSVTLPRPAVGAVLFGVAFTDVIDSRLRIDDFSAAGATALGLTGSTITATFNSVPASAQRTIFITTTVRDLTTVTQGSTITNQASFDYDAYPGGAIQSNPVTTTIREPNVSIHKSVEVPRTPLGAGDVITYALVLSNAGNWPAHDLVVTDSLPAGLSFMATENFRVTDPTTATLTDTNLAGSTALEWQSSQLAPAGTVYITFTARVSIAIDAGLILINEAWGRYSNLPGTDPNERPYVIPVVTAPVEIGYPDLDMRKRVNTTTIEAGDVITYQIVVTNNGVVSATGAVITDVLPDSQHASYLSCGPQPCIRSGNIITWSLGTLDVGHSRTVSLAMQVRLGTINGTLITNTGWVSCDQGITDTDYVVTPVGSDHILQLNKQASPDPVQAGAVLSYTLNWQVIGNQDALGLVITDRVPMSTSYLSCSPVLSCSETGGVVKWDLGNQAYDASGSVSFSVVVTHPLVSGTLIYNTAAITDRQGMTATTELTTPVNSQHSLEVSKSMTPAVVRPGGWLTYTIIYTVTGNEPVLDVTLSDETPADTSFLNSIPEADIHPSPGSSGQVVWNLGDFLPEASGLTVASGVVTLVVQANSSLPDGLVIRNTALITDSSHISNTGTASSTVESSHHITIAKTAAVTTAGLGDLITYTLNFTVAGDEPTAPFIRDDVASPVVFVSASGGVSVEHPAAGDTGTVIWHLGTLSPTPSRPATGSVTLTVRVAQKVTDGQTLQNVASMHSGALVTDDPFTITMQAPTLHFAKISNPASTVRPNDLVTYLLCYSNSGSVTATNVLITDFIPVNTTYATGSATPGSGSVQFYDGTTWRGSEPANVIALRWKIPEVSPNGTMSCISFQITVNTVLTLDGQSLILTDLGWALAGTITGGPPVVVTATPTVTPGATPAPTPIPTTTPTYTATASPSPEPVPTPAPVISSTATAVPITTPAAEIPTPVPMLSPSPETPVTSTVAPMPTAIFTVTPIPTPTETATPTPELPVTIEPESSPTAAETATEMPPATDIPTPTGEPTATAVNTPVPTVTSEPPTNTPIPEQEPTPTDTGVSTQEEPLSAANPEAESQVGFWAPLAGILSMGAIIVPLADEATESQTPAATSVPTPPAENANQDQATSPATATPEQAPTVEADQPPTPEPVENSTPTPAAAPTEVEPVPPTPNPRPTQTPAPSNEPTAIPTAEPLEPIPETATPMVQPVDTPTPGQAPSPLGIVTGDVVNVRQGPGTNHPVIGKVKGGDLLEITGRNDTADWVRMFDQNQDLAGWVSVDLLELSVPVLHIWVVSTPQAPEATETGTPVGQPNPTTTLQMTPILPSPAVPTTTAIPVNTITPAPTVSQTPPLPSAQQPSIVVLEAIKGAIVNTASLGSGQTPIITSVVENPLLGSVDPYVTKAGEPDMANIGDVVTFTIQVGNIGDAGATDVMLIDPLPIFVDVLSAEASKGNVNVYPASAPQTVTVDIGTLYPGETIWITITTRVNEHAAPPPREIRNQAELLFGEGPPAQSAVVVVNVPTPTPTPTETPTPTPTKGPRPRPGPDDTPTPMAQPSPTVSPTPTLALLPVQRLPETGNRLPLNGLLVLLLLVLVAGGCGVLAARVTRARQAK